jgi:chemotaxis protein methyltransferase CheR
MAPAAMREALDLGGQWSDEGMIPVIELVSRRTGLWFPPARMAAVEQTLQRARLDAGARNWEAFLNLLVTDARVFDALAGGLTVNESYFFRDPAQFEYLRTVLLPRLAADAGPIRFWSAGCAAGQEPYTLAILTDQLGLADRSRIVGTDIAPRRLATAARGRFARWSLRGVAPEIVERYFRPVDMRHELRPSLRSRVEFRQMNLADPAAWAQAPAAVDVLLCRNVLIYFDEEAVARTARHLVESLSDRGRLLLGASDPPISDYVECRVEVTPAGLVYRKAGARHFTPPSPPPTSPTARESRPLVLPARSARDDALSLPQPADRSPDPAPAPSATAIRALANSGRVQAALDACLDALRARPTDVEACCLQAMLLSQAGRHAESAAAARRALYLDRSLILGHVALGVALSHLGDRAGAARSLGTASELLANLSDDDALPAGDGETASRMRASVAAHLDLLGGP